MPKVNKRQRFKKLAESRVRKILKLIQLLGNQGNPQFYEFTEQDLEKITSAVTSALQEAVESIRSNKKVRFSLKD